MSDSAESASAPSALPPTETAHPLDDVIATIRASVAPRASTDARTAGATACRTILTVLEAKPGESLAGGSLGAPITAPPPGSPLGGLAAQLGALPRDKLIDVIKHLVAAPSSPLDGVLGQLAGMPREQMLALINQKLRAVAPGHARPPATGAPRFHLIPIPPVPPARKPGGGP